MNTITDHSVAHVLYGTELTLIWRGWGQHALEADGPQDGDGCGPMCLVGAVIFAIAGSVTPWAEASLDEADETLVGAACRMLAEAIGDHEGDAGHWADASISDIECWNDAPGRTFSEILAVLRRAQILAGGAP